MQITKSNKKLHQQKQQQQQQQQQQQLQPQQQQPQPQPPQQQQQLQQDQKGAKMFKVSMFRVSKWKLLVAAVSACLVAALIARCSSNKSEIEETKNQLKDKLKSVRDEQKLVRQYVKGVLARVASGPQGRAVGGGQFEEHLFAKTVLNAFDRPYEQVIAVINRLQDELSRVGQPDAALNGPGAARGSGGGGGGGGVGNGGQQQQHEEAQRLLVEAYGRALEESQRHSVLIQNEIRRQQERVPNADGKLSKTEATLRAWPLEQLAQFERRLIEAYLNEALRDEPSA